MSDETDSNIVQLVQPKRDEEKLLDIVVTNNKTASQKHCKHLQTQVSEVDRTVLCLQCGSMLDPFEVILDRAKSGGQIIREIHLLYQRRDELRESVANLEREEKNTKARLRAAKTAILYAENDLKNVEQGVKK